MLILFLICELLIRGKFIKKDLLFQFSMDVNVRLRKDLNRMIFNFEFVVNKNVCREQHQHQISFPKLF